MISKLRLTSAALTGLLLLSACAKEAPPPGPIAEFVDAEGKPVTLTDLPVKRIVSTMQSVTEWIVELGAADLIVARTDYDREGQLQKLPSIGGGLDPSPEAIAALHPDLVIGWQNRSSVDLQHSLAPFKIPVVSMETPDTAALFHHLSALSKLVDKKLRGDTLAKWLREDLAAIRATSCPVPDTLPHPTVLVILWTDPPMTSGGGTWMNTLLETACLKNVFGDFKASWPTVSMEAIVSRQPDWLLTSLGLPGQRLTELRALPGWKDLKAVREGRVIEIAPDMLSRAGPSIVEATKALVTATKK